MKKRYLFSLLTAVMTLTSLANALTTQEINKINAALPAKAKSSPKKIRKILVFNRSEGKYVHSAIPYGQKMLELMGKKTGAFTTVNSTDMSVFNPENLQQFDAICFNNSSHLKFENPVHKKSLLDFVKSGKGFIGLHGAIVNFKDWPEGAEMLGGRFENHPWLLTGLWSVKIDEPLHPLARAFKQDRLIVSDELYQLLDKPYSRNNLRVLLSIDMQDPRNHKVDKTLVHRKDNDFALSWIKNYGKGRVFFCELGHNHHIFWTPHILEFICDGIQFALGDLKVDANPIKHPAKNINLKDLAPWRNTEKWFSAGDAVTSPHWDDKLMGYIGSGTIINGTDGKAQNLVTNQQFGDCALHLEFMIPKGSNSGVYLMGRYEVQIKDSENVDKPQYSDCGGIYQRGQKIDNNLKPADEKGYPPITNAASAPGSWQTFDIIFSAPKFENGKKIANARFDRVVLNGTVIHQNVEVFSPTRASLFNDEKPQGPLMLQGDHGPVAFRNIRLYLK
jgi:type 1 glutamine amidotransferase